MPNPVPLATKEEEDRRAWVTAHHEVVRLIKECFGDRFSNNEIFDRLKISRRTGYRALGNDERIGKAPGRKPKISDQTIKEMIHYIDEDKCSGVGNVWKHLAEKFAPECNPKTVQDAVKKSGFKNNRSQVKLAPLLNVEVSEHQPAPLEDLDGLQTQATPGQQMHGSPQFPQYHFEANQFDSGFPPSNAARDILNQSIDTAYEATLRHILKDACNRFSETEHLTSSYLCPQLTTQPISHLPAPAPTYRAQPHTDSTPLSAKRTPRPAICRRCNAQYDRQENSMDNRHCLYHKGSPQKTDPTQNGSIEEVPAAYTWSCCGGNGMVRGCCRAMHTTKKKRKYGKKRTAAEAGLDDKDDDNEESVSPAPEVSTQTLLSNAQRSHLNETQHERTQFREQQQHQQSSPVLSSQHDDSLSHPRHTQQPPHTDQQQHRSDQVRNRQHSSNHQQTQYRPLQPHHQQNLPHDPDNIDHRVPGMTAEMPSQAEMSTQLDLMFGHQLQDYNASQPQDPTMHGQPLYQTGQPVDHQGFQVLQSNGHLDSKHDPNDQMSAHPGMDQVAHHLAQSQTNGHDGVQLSHGYQFGPIQDLRQQG